ncbi:MAG: hypothetical protein JW862_10525 [Anaerolineales bacterium]|nr:hypothetical protein [Anaerolineales bacterium]
MKKHPLVWSTLFVLLAIVFAWLSPLEQTLGSKARFVYFHGAWVWVGILGFILAAILGAAGLITRHSPIQQWSRAWGRTSLFFWLLFLPMSLYAMQANWGGLYLDEPRWQIPLNLAIIGLLLQVGLAFFPLVWSAVGNLLFGLYFIWSMWGTQAVLHPDSPIFNAEAGSIQIFYIGMVFILLLAAWQQARWFYQRSEKHLRS